MKFYQMEGFGIYFQNCFNFFYFGHFPQRGVIMIFLQKSKKLAIFFQLQLTRTLQFCTKESLFIIHWKANEKSFPTSYHRAFCDKYFPNWTNLKIGGKSGSGRARPARARDVNTLIDVK